MIRRAFKLPKELHDQLIKQFKCSYTIQVHPKTTDIVLHFKTVEEAEQSAQIFFTIATHFPDLKMLDGNKVFLKLQLFAR